jgi:HEAT repeat protein
MRHEREAFREMTGHDDLPIDYREALALGAPLSDMLEALTWAGKKDLLEFEPQVRALLHHPDEVVRIEALFTLGSRWSLPEFRDRCEAIWRDQNESTSMRATALGAWTSYFIRSYDQSVVDTLRQLLESEEDPDLRAQALDSIANVASDRPGQFLRYSSKILRAEPGDVHDLIPWGAVNTLIHNSRQGRLRPD